MSELLRPGAGEYGEYYQQYVDLAPDDDVLAGLREQGAATQAFLAEIPEERGSFRYAPGKWSIKEVVGHLLDTERVFAYRAMTVARGDTTALPGFDQDDWVSVASFDARSLADLARELDAARKAHLALFSTLAGEDGARVGSANGLPLSARAVPFICLGHERHHLNVLRERYG